MARVDDLVLTEQGATSSLRPRAIVTPDAPLSSLVDGRYRVLGRLAQGAMGIIYRAEDVLLQRPAALKVIDPSVAHTTDSIDLFLREARALARLRHDNVVQIYAFGASGPSYYFAMELVDGKNLEDTLTGHANAGTSMGLALVIEIVQKVAGGLTAAHGRAVTHRDVKPANIVLEHETGRAVLVDFGIARQATDTHLENSSGTPTYMAPEQIRNEEGHDGARADLYSLACTAFEMLCGDPPFAGGQAYEIMLAHMQQPPPLLSSLRPEYEPLDGVFARALAKNPTYRHESCLAFAQDLAKAAKGVSDPSEPKELLHELPVPHAHVLILAEDDGIRRSLVRESMRSLRKVGIDHPEIECVSNGSALYEEVRRRRPEVVVLDDDAAGGTSVELARTLRSLEGGDAMHIIVLTRDMLADRSVWQSINAKRLSKPLSPRALASTLDALVFERL